MFLKVCFLSLKCWRRGAILKCTIHYKYKELYISKSIIGIDHACINCYNYIFSTKSVNK